MKQSGDYVTDREVKNMDYIPSNRHGDYIAHSEEYLMHYGVKGMKWKDHDYVEDVKTGAREVVGDVKSKIKQLKKFVSKKFGKKTQKPKTETREERNARIKENQIRTAAENDRKNPTVQQRNRNNSQSYGQNRAYNHIQTEKYYKTAAAKEADRKRTRDAGYDTANGMKAVADNKNKRINSSSGYVNSGTSTRDADIRKGTQNSMNVTRDSRTGTKIQATNNINRLVSEATPKRPDPKPVMYQDEIDDKLKRTDTLDPKHYLKVKKSKSNR